MTGRLCLGAAAGLILTALGGCAFDAATYTISRYGASWSTNVTLRCRDTYEVLDRPDAATMLVGTNPLNEVLAGCLDGGPDATTRQREAARIYLSEKTNRPFCRIVDERDVTLTHREFSYACPANPAVPRLQRPR
jgi:hypothetical protein